MIVGLLRVITTAPGALACLATSLFSKVPAVSSPGPEGGLISPRRRVICFSAKPTMNQDQWTAVDRYITGLLVPPDAALDGALRDSAAAGLPPIAGSPAQGKLLHLLARTQGARRILEIGTLGGYSTIWLARALPAGGQLMTLEVDPRHAEAARANIARAGLAGVVELRLGPALETLPQLIAEKSGPFDLIFIDADKGAIPEYFARALELSRHGTLIIVDNVVRNGAVAGQHRSCRNWRPPLPPTAGRRTARQRHDDPDRRQQRIRRIHLGAGHRRPVARVRLGGGSGTIRQGNNLTGRGPSYDLIDHSWLARQGWNHKCLMGITPHSTLPRSGVGSGGITR